jgi:hypothetical protein
LTIGLVLHGQTAAPYHHTRARTAGPDVVAAVFPAPNSTVTAADRARLRAVARRPEVAARSRAFPTAWAPLSANGISGVAQVQGRDVAPSLVDRPQVVSGRWVGRDGVVVERAFAQAMGLSVGDRVDLGGPTERVAGIAVSAALPPYPQLCTIGCILDHPDWFSAEPGLVWTTRQHARGLATHDAPWSGSSSSGSTIRARRRRSHTGTAPKVRRGVVRSRTPGRRSPPGTLSS